MANFMLGSVEIHKKLNLGNGSIVIVGVAGQDMLAPFAEGGVP